MNYINIAKKVIADEIEGLHELSSAVDENFSQAIEAILATNGKVVFCGVGKSGLIAQKISATFSSTGTSSFFIHPTEALHGDFGVLSKNDLLILISFSGKSDELLSLIPHIKRGGYKTICITNSHQSNLAKTCDISLALNVSREACPLKSAPTTSTTATLALGDALAIALMNAKNITHEDFASNHPAGALGKKLFVKASTLIKSKNLPKVAHDSTLKDAINEMTKGKLGHVLIEENGDLIAILSDGDLRRALMDKAFNINNKALDYATKNPKTLTDISMLASEVLQFLEENKIQIVVFVEDKKTRGIIHIHDLIEAGIS